jgi:hypothetical protein
MTKARKASDYACAQNLIVESKFRAGKVSGALTLTRRNVALKIAENSFSVLKPLF